MVSYSFDFLYMYIITSLSSLWALTLGNSPRSFKMRSTFSHNQFHATSCSVSQSFGASDLPPVLRSRVTGMIRFWTSGGGGGFCILFGSFLLPFLSESLKARFSGNAAHDVHSSLSANMNCRQCLPVVIYIYSIGPSIGPCNLPADDGCQPQSGKHHGPKIWQRDGLCVLGQDKDQNIALFLVDESWAML